jgi:hypothetical protein
VRNTRGKVCGYGEAKHKSEPELLAEHKRLWVKHEEEGNRANTTGKDQTRGGLTDGIRETRSEALVASG